VSMRRTVATLLSALVLSGGAGALTGCTDPSKSGTGTPADTATDTSASVPSDSSQATLSPSASPPTSSAGG
jgi:hypothetical protein